MNIRQLEAFHATIETGSVTRAGEKLRISQPAVSKLLRAFAQTCGFQLFVRSGSRLVPTLEARLLAVEVERMFSGTERIARLANAVRNREWGEVSVAAPAAFATRYLGQVLAPFLGSQPDLHFTLQSRPSPQITELVASQQIDIGLSVLPADHPHVRAEIIMRFAMICVLPVGHPLADRQAVRVVDLIQTLQRGPVLGSQGVAPGQLLQGVVLFHAVQKVIPLGAHGLGARNDGRQRQAGG